MRRVLLACMLTFGLTANLNYAPKVENPASEKRLAVCIPSYNNQEYFEKNLDSVFSQNYKNYRVVYVDDASTDDTWELVSAYVKEKGLEDRITLIHNDVNVGPLANWYKMVTSLDDDEIVVSLDGDDWLAHDNVLKRVNQAYSDKNVWVTYGRWESYPEKIGAPKDPMSFSSLKWGRHRSKGFIWTHLRTFYAGLFKKVPSSRFKDRKGRFFTQAGDVAIMTNLVDLAREHTYYMPEVLYIYNQANPLNECKVFDRKNCPSRLVFSRPPLKRLQNWR